MSIEKMKQALEALQSIRRYGLDTLSGRTDGPDDRDWQRAGVNEMTKRARIGATALRQAIEQAEKQEPVAWGLAEKVFLVLRKRHPRFAKMDPGCAIEEVIAACVSHEEADAALTAAEEEYHYQFPGYRVEKRDPPKVWEILEMSLNMSHPPAPQREWVGLTDEDRKAAFESMPDMLEGFLYKWGWLHFSKAIEAKLKEKNT